jgi:hypothetical protein
MKTANYPILEAIKTVINTTFNGTVASALASSDIQRDLAIQYDSEHVYIVYLSFFVSRFSFLVSRFSLLASRFSFRFSFLVLPRFSRS